MFQNDHRYYCSVVTIEFFLLIFLKKIKAITDDCCNFCKEESETIQHVFLFVCLKFIVPLENQHVFISCMHSLPVWSKLSMHICRNTGKRIVFHFYNALFGETSIGKDNKIANFIILYTKQDIYLCLKQKKLPIFLWAYIFFEVKIQTWKVCLSLKFSHFWKMVVTFERYFLCLVLRDRVFKSIIIYHILMFKHVIEWMKVWKKSVSIMTIQNYVRDRLYPYDFAESLFYFSGG